MFSFPKTLSFAAAAFATFAAVSAAPLSVAALAGVDLHAGAHAIAGLPRDVQGSSVACVLTDLTVKLQPIVLELTYVTSENATVEALTPVVAQATVLVQDAVAELNGLVGLSVDVILAGVGGAVKITLSDLVGLLSVILTLVFTAVGHVLAVVKGDVSVVIKVFAPLNGVIFGLLHIVVALVGSVLGDVVTALVAVIGGIVPIILRLNLSAVVTILHI